MISWSAVCMFGIAIGLAYMQTLKQRLVPSGGAQESIGIVYVNLIFSPDIADGMN